MNKNAINVSDTLYMPNYIFQLYSDILKRKHLRTDGFIGDFFQMLRQK